MQNEWQKFFDEYAPLYMGHEFTHNAVAEVDFILEEFDLPPGGRVLDMGCGTGRHAVELARRGYKVTGVDISSGMLDEARKAAEQAGVAVEWVQADAVRFTPRQMFDAAICLCEGAFGLVGSGEDPIEHDLAILRNVAAALKPGARFILNALNAMEKIRRCSQADVQSGRFDPATLVEMDSIDWETPEGKRSHQGRERGYVPTEFVMMLRQAGFVVEHIWGGTAGGWNRQPLNLDEMEIMAVSRKP